MSTWRDVIKVHPAADLFPMMSDAELVELSDDIGENGLRSPVILWSPDRDLARWLRRRSGSKKPKPEFYLVDGRNRMSALEARARVEFTDDGWPVIDFVSPCFDHAVTILPYDEDPYVFVISANIRRRHLTAEQKRTLIGNLLKADPTKSDRQIAEVVKASPTTVGTVRAKMEESGDVSKLDTRTDTKGREQPARKSGAASTLAVLSSSASVEWYTPAPIVAKALQVLGTIDMDPCWHADSPVRAKIAYCQDDDGMSKRWKGRVWLNPPYGRTIDRWIEKLVADYGAGHVSEALALVPARVDTEWFARLDRFPRCFIRGRLTFANADNPAPFPCAVVYLGGNVAKFASVFGDVGSLWTRLAAKAAE